MTKIMCKIIQRNSEVPVCGETKYMQQSKQTVFCFSRYQDCIYRISGYQSPVPKSIDQKSYKLTSYNFSVPILLLDTHGQTVLCVMCGCRVNHLFKHLLSASVSDKVRVCHSSDKHGPEQHYLNTALLSFKIVKVSMLQC